MGTNLIRAMLLASAGAAGTVVVFPAAAYAQEATYQIDIPAQSMGDALRALGRATKQNIVFDGAVVRGKRSAAVRGRMTASDALQKMISGSGLVMARGAGGALTVRMGNDAASTSRTEASSSGVDIVATPSASASTVVDARTGAALKGALVEIVETGEKTSTGNLGEFRFPGKAGSFNIRVSYLGYPEYQQYVDLKDGRAITGILLPDGSSSNEIVVTAYQSARAQALNQERAAENTSTVVSSDLLGQFDGNTISDALRRAPGVAFVVDNRTGDGANVIVRGLPSSFNTVTLNGLRLPVGDGASRSPSLGNILSDSVSKITINKTLLPNQDGTGTGALIDIETKGPLDRPARYFNVSVDKAGSAKGFLDETNIAGTASFRFGAERNFGISASVQYRKRDITNIQISTTGVFPRYLPATDGGRPVTSAFSIDPRRLFPFEDGVDELYQGQVSIGQNQSSVENLAIGLSTEWKIGTHTNLKFDYNRNQADQSDFLREVAVNSFTGNELLPIDELGGELRYARVWEGLFGPGLPISVGHTVSLLPNTKNVTSSFAFQGETNLGRWEFDYRAGYATAQNSNLGGFSISFSPAAFFVAMDRSHLTPEILANTAADRLVSPFPAASAGFVSLPGLNADGYAIVNDSALYTSSLAGLSANKSNNKRLTGAFSAKYNFDNAIIKYIEGGVFYERSNVRGVLLPSDVYNFGSASIADLGLSFSDGILDKIGLPNNFNAIGRQDFEVFYARLRAGSVPGTVITHQEFPEPPGFRGLREETLAAYLQSRFELGKLEIVGGVRVEHVNTVSGGERAAVVFLEGGLIDTDFFSRNPASPITLSGSDTRVLPRIQANYRFNDELILRAGFYQTYSRPNVSQLNGSPTLTLVLDRFFGPAGNQAGLFISLPNPGLKAAITNNFDMSVEWYSGTIGVLKAGLFFKPTKNPFFANVDRTGNSVPESVELPDDPRFSDPDLFINVTQPGNANYTTRFWGYELSVERRFDFLPGLLSAFGVYANYTHTDGKRQVRTDFAFAPGGEIVSIAPYSLSPKHAGTAALTFSQSGLDASLAYTRQSRYLIGNPGDFGLSGYRDAISSLDFKASYQAKLYAGEARFFVEASNLLRGSGDPNATNSFGGTQGVPKAMYEASYIGGRVFRGGFSFSF